MPFGVAIFAGKVPASVKKWLERCARSVVQEEQTDHCLTQRDGSSWIWIYAARLSVTMGKCRRPPW